MITRRTLPLLLATPALAQAVPPLFVLGTGATETPIEQIAHALTARTGRAIHAETGNGGQVAQRIRAGEVVDVVLNAGAALDALIRDGFALADSRREMGRMRLAVAMRRGAPTPVITPQPIRQARSNGISAGTPIAPDSGTTQYWAWEDTTEKWCSIRSPSRRYREPPSSRRPAGWWRVNGSHRIGWSRSQ